MATDNVVLNKTAAIERCIRRVLEEYRGFEEEFATNYTKQDSIILNLERLCQAAIDLAAHLVRVKKLGIPQDNRELFQLLEQNGLISEKLSRNLQSMVGFRNLAIHDYQELNLEIIQSIINNHLADFQAFSKIALHSQKYSP
jgi:uncharacterized protein YutE (UPF0331/DUF86 family)